MDFVTKSDNSKYFVFTNTIRSNFDRMACGQHVRLCDASDPYVTTHFCMDAVRLQDHEKIGRFSFRQDMLKRIHLEPEIFPLYRGHGYAKEAVGLCLDFADAVLARPIKYIYVMPDNDAAKALFKGFGFKEGGLMTYDFEIDRSPDFPDEAKLGLELNGMTCLSLIR